MKTLRALAIAGSMLVAIGCTPNTPEQQQLNVFRSNVSVGVMRLRSAFSELEPQTAEREADCRSLIFEMMAMCEDDLQSQALSDKLTEALARSDTFNMYDYYVLWLAGDHLRAYPPADAAFLRALAKKVEAARAADPPDIYHTQYSAMAVGYLLSATSYNGRVDTYEDRVDYNQWESLKAWMDANGNKLVYDESIKIYRPRDVVPEEKPERTVPEE